MEPRVAWLRNQRRSTVGVRELRIFSGASDCPEALHCCGSEPSRARMGAKGFETVPRPKCNTVDASSILAASISRLTITRNVAARQARNESIAASNAVDGAGGLGSASESFAPSGYSAAR